MRGCPNQAGGDSPESQSCYARGPVLGKFGGYGGNEGHLTTGGSGGNVDTSPQGYPRRNVGDTVRGTLGISVSLGMS